MKELIEQLVEASYIDGILNAATVMEIADRLTRTQLKAYIHALREHEKRSTLIVEVPSEKAIGSVDALSSIFGNKKVTYIVNPDLLLGARIRDNDDVYNMNFKTTLERIAAYATE